MYAWITHEKLTPELTLSVVNVTWWERDKDGRMVAYETEYYKGTPSEANDIVETFKMIRL